MHLLAAQAGAIQQEGEAIDLGQAPGDIVFASSADSELSLLAGAADRALYDNLRLANLLRLSHNLSVDLWLDNTVRHAKLVIVRLLGGPAYWQYGVDELIALAATRKIRLALLPGDATPDSILRDRSTIPPDDWDLLFSLLVTGGAENADAALAAMRAVSPPPLREKSDGNSHPSEGAFAAFPLARFGLWPTPAPDPSPQGGGEQTATVSGAPNRRSKRQKKIGRARDLRLQGTVPERRIWQLLRLLTADGYHFRRQVPIGHYFADFACHHPKLVIEIDGETHATAPGETHDAARDTFLKSTGYAVLRFSNSDVVTNPEGVYDTIVATLASLAAPSLPSPLRGGVGGGGGPQIQPDRLSTHQPDPTIPIVFYRALLEGAGTAVIEALVTALEAKNLAPLPIFVSSLKEPEAVAFVQKTFAANPPAVILNLTGFALGIDGLPPEQNPFSGTDAPVIQLIQGGRPEALWAADSQGLSPKDLAMQLVMPELDGRIGGILVGHKAESVWHARTQCPLTAYAPDADGISRAVELAANWVRLRQTPRADRRIAIVLANYPIRDGRLANGVGYDAPQSTIEILRALDGAGYDLATPSPPSPLRGGIEGRGGPNTPDLEDRALSNPEGVSSPPTPALNPSPQGAGEQQEAPHTQPDISPPAGEDGRVEAAVSAVETAAPTSGNALIDFLQSGPTNAHPDRDGGIAFSLARYRELFCTLPAKIQAEVKARWGEPGADPFVRGDKFHLPAIRFGNVAILLQPARGYDRDDAANYHDPDLVPPHAYLAAYLWLRHEFAAHAIIHNGKHGSLEWLPGKATALDAASYPAALWGGLPHLYPFIVNDPGEGTQAKRRTGAVIIDHLVPPLTRAETYGPLKDLEALLDEYYAASGLDRRRLADLRRRILAFTRDVRLDEDIALPADEGEALKTIDNFLCDLKEAQIRDGLHVFGQSPAGALERDLIVALARVPRGEGAGEASLIRALADDLKLGFDPLTVKLGDDWTGPCDANALFGALATYEGNFGAEIGAFRTVGDVLETLEKLAAALVEKTILSPPEWTATCAVLDTIESVIRPRLQASGPNEIKALLDGLDGKFVAPGPSGAPSRGRLDVLPTGRNFYSVDNRAVPTATAWELGRKSAENLLLRHSQDHGMPLKSLALSVWGTANMRTGGDDIAQALAFIGARPVWDPGSLRVSGYEIIPLARLGRPRVDVTLRISGFFRDAFPAQIALFDRAVRAIGALDEPDDQNPIAAKMRADALGLAADGMSEATAAQQAGYRIFGSKPGAYGAGLQGPIDSGKWESKADLAEAFLNWGQYAYGAKEAGVPDRGRFAARLSDIDAVIHNQDNREHDLLDSDDYYQFEGGLAVTAEALTGRQPAAYHNDHSRPERPLTRTLGEEISKVMRSRVVNPKWIAGVKRHGYKGAFEIIATVDYMFAFAATTGAVKSHHFDLAFAAFVEDPATRDFIRENNRFGYDELIAKFSEAKARGLWTPRSNAAYALLEEKIIP